MPQAQRLLPRELLAAAAITCGLLLALAVHIITSRLGLGLASAWREAGLSPTDQLRSAIAWWMIAAAGGFGGFASAVLLADPPRRTLPRTILEWTAAVAFLLLLAGAEHYGTGEVGIGTNAKLMAGLIALTEGALMAALGTFLALRLRRS
jgi:hypothetical protein